mgnify:CR=1 FL=1
MARTETTNLDLGMWTDGEAPGAGTQDMGTIGIGINDNWKIIDAALGTGHNADGTHKAEAITGANINPAAVDGVTIVQDAITKKLGVPDGGIDTAQIAAGAVTATEIADGSITAAKLAATVLSPRALWQEALVAGAADGDEAAAITIWQQGSTEKVKIRTVVYLLDGDKYVRLVGSLYNASAKNSMVTLNVVTLAAVADGSATFTKSANPTTPENFSIDVDVSGESLPDRFEVYVTIQSAVGGTAKLTTPVILAIPG